MVTLRSGLSPAVRVQEFDLSDYVNNQVNTLTLLIGNTPMGPAFKVDVVVNEKDFIDRYGGPTNENVGTFFAASGYFSRGGNLIFTRIVDRPTAVVSAIGFDAETETSQDGQTFVNVENLDPYIYNNNLDSYSYIDPDATMIENADIASAYASQWHGVQAFNTRHTIFQPVEWEPATEYAEGDYIYDGVESDPNRNVYVAQNNGITFETEWEPQVNYEVGDYIVMTHDIVEDYKVVGSFNRMYKVTTGGASSAVQPSWNTDIGETTNDNDVIWEAVANSDYTANLNSDKGQTTHDNEIIWEALGDQVTLTNDGLISYQHIGGVRFKWGHSIQPVYYDPDDTSTFAFNVTLNGEEKQEDLIISAIGPGEAYNDYQIALIGYRDAMEMRRASYSRASRRGTLRSNSPVPVAYNNWGTTSNPIYKHFLSKVTYNEFINTFNYINELGDNIPRAEKEFGIFVLVKDTVSNVWQTVEYFRVSSDENSYDDNGQSLYVEEVLNTRSQLIRAKLNDTGKNAEFTTTLPIPLRGGTVGQLERFGQSVERGGQRVTLDGEVINAADIYRESDIEIDLIIDGDKPLVAKKEMAILAEDLNAEAFAILDVPAAYERPLDQIRWLNEQLLLNTSYAGIYHNRYKVYDKYNGIYRWVAGSGTIAGVMTKVDQDYFPWYAPAGSRRGVLNEIIDIREKFRLPSRDILYANRINPVAIIRNAITIYGQKTLLDRDSYLNRINVRRLINFCKRRCRKLAESFVFEFNDEFTRNIIEGIFDEFLTWVQNNRGIHEFLVVCNEVNNPPIVRDNNQLYCDIYIKPTPVAEFLYLRFFITRAGIDLQALATRVAP